MIKYIGSKRSLVDWIVGVVQRIHAHIPITTVADLFSGSARVAHTLKAHGFYVYANDYASYAYTLAHALVEADRAHYPPERVQPLLETLMHLPLQYGWFTRTYCEEARYFRPENGARIEAIRNAIDGCADPTLKSVLLTSLMLAADKVDSTTGLQMAYLKRWAPRAYQPLRLRYPPLLPGAGKALQEDALELAGALEADLFYLDPPYNQHSYLANYHVWETLVLWDCPETYGVACKRVDVKHRKSPFNARTQARPAMEYLVNQIRAKHLLVSFNDEGYLTREELEAILSEWGYVARFERPYRRYVGALIGIHNPRGEKVGQVSHTRNTEMLFVATKYKSALETLTNPAPSQE
ncbi:MAG: DNA adenine methylase [Fimbriimonadales bacterium]|nr:MAG: restriction endonuclease subunit M [Fimbriimonadales bacterium]